MSRISKPAYPGIFLLALSILLFQVALTRVFAIMMWHHLTYMVVSIALLGFGAAGSFLTARGEGLKQGSPMGALTWFTAGYGASVVLCFALVTRIDVDSIQLLEDTSNLWKLLALYALISVPFLLGGAAIGLALTRYVEHVNKLYFADLVGSAVGAALSVVCLAAVGGTATVVMASVLGMFAALAFSLGAGPRHRGVAGAGLALSLLCALWVTGVLPGFTWDPPFAPGKEFSRLAADAEIDRIYSSTAEVEVGPHGPSPPALGGDVGWPDRAPVPSRLVGQDGTAPTVLFEGAAELERFGFLRTTQAASAYTCLEARGGGEPDVLVIGVGGGVDVMKALAHGARSVTAVEINKAMLAMVTERYDTYLGGLFRPGAHEYSNRVQLVNREGRSHMRSRDERYDVIQMSGVDSFTALSTGAYTLSESYLYTTQAVAEFYEHLEDDGYINYSRFILSPAKQPRETLRLAHIACTALRELGVEDPASQVLVFQGEVWASTLIKRGAFTRAEIDALEALARDQGYLGLVFDPLHPAGEPIEPRIEFVARSWPVRQALGLSLASAGLGLDTRGALEPAVDALTPAYVAQFREDGHGEGEALADFLQTLPPEQRGPGFEAARRILGETAGPGRQVAEAFAATRMKYERLLRGDETQRAEFLASYEYDVSACTDDKPFFFNYYRFSELFRRLFADEREHLGGPIYHTDLPIGHLVLLASLVQIAVLAALLIFLPLRKLNREGLRSEGTWRFFGYFAALGAGFMFIEIVLMQKMVIFLGHPTYAVSVVLASLLGFAGLGSFLAGRVSFLSRGVLMKLVFAVAGFVLLAAFSLDALLPPLLALPLGLRVCVVVALLCPLGLCLGMPFPSGMRIVQSRAPQLLPWCWAINGFLSVFSSVFCIVLSMWIGFTAVLALAAGIYLLGFLVMPAEREAQPAP